MQVLAVGIHGVEAVFGGQVDSLPLIGLNSESAAAQVQLHAPGGGARTGGQRGEGQEGASLHALSYTSW